MNQKKLAVWIVVIFLITSCTDLMEPSSLAIGQVSQTKDCPDFEITILGGTSAAPGDSLSLAVSPTSLDRQYQWSASDGSFSSALESLTTFIAPKAEGRVVVSVVGVSDLGCENVRASKDIVVANPPTFTPAATDMASPTHTPAFTVVPTDTPTIEPTATNTLEPTVAFTNTPPPTLLPAYTPTPTVPAFTILLQEPKDNTCIGSENAVFQWLATRPLNTIDGINGEYFAINIWSDDSPRYSVSWIKDPRYEIDNITDPIAVYTQQINCSGEKGCYWSVDMIVSHVERGSGWKPESFTPVASSQVRKFCTYPNPAPQPTNTPVPTATPCNLPPSQCK